MLAPVHAFVRQSGATGQLGEAQVLTLVRGHLEQQATAAAYQDCFVLVALLYLASVPLRLLLRRP